MQPTLATSPRPASVPSLDASSTLLRTPSPAEAARADASSDPAAHHYNTALTLAAHRSSVWRAYYLNQLLLICGGANAADAVEILSVSFILPSATDDLQLSGVEKGWLAGMIFAGMLIGGWMWGALSDRYGRRRCLLACLLINAVGGVLSSIAPSFWLILLCRFISGVGVGGSVPVVFTYFSEFLSTRDRGAFMVGIACCWMIGSLFTAALAWVVVPREVSFELAGLTVHSWRIFAFLCALPSFACAAALHFYEESPRWLLSRPDAESTLQAKRILVQMYEVNHAREILDSERADARAGIGGGVGGAPTSEEYLEELARGKRNRWCGACCYGRRTRSMHARAYLVPTPPAPLPATPVPAVTSVAETDTPLSDAAALSPGSSHSRVSGGGTHSGSHGIKYSTLDIARDDRSSSSELVADTPLSEASDADAAAAVHVGLSDDGLDALYSTLPERERWRLFVLSLAHLDAAPVTTAASSERASSSSSLSPSPDAHMLPPFSVADGRSTDGWRASDEDVEGVTFTPSESRSGRCARALDCFTRAHMALRVVLRKTGQLFRADSRAHTVKLLLVWFFLAFGYYGLTLWMPQYFADQDAKDKDDDSNPSTGHAMYVTAFVGALSALPANVLTLWSVRHHGRIRTLVCGLLLSSLCVLLVPLLQSQSAAEAMLTIFAGVNTAAWNALNVSTTEVFRTDIRATAFGFCAAVGRLGAILGNLMYGVLSSSSQTLPLVFTASALLLAAIASATLPETKSANLA